MYNNITHPIFTGLRKTPGTRMPDLERPEADSKKVFL